MQPYSVELVTPAFPGGPDPRNKDEFEGVRPSSVVYGLRWWFRALAGAVMDHRDIDAMRNAEAGLFGAAHSVRLPGQPEPVQGLRSRVRIDVSSNVNLDKCPTFEDRDIWLRYLAYGMYPTNREAWRRKFIPPGERFEVTLGVRRFADEVPAVAAGLVDALFRLWVEFGGLGARWRHGFGAMRLAGSAPANPATYSREAGRLLATGRERMRAYLDAREVPTLPAGPDRAQLPAFPVAVDPFLKLAWRDNAGADWRAALKTVFDLWRRSRQKDPDSPRSSTWNASLYARFLRGDAHDGERAELAGLGLPIPFGFPQGVPGVTRGSIGVLTVKGQDRRASPIWFRPIRTAGGLGLLALLWDCRYLAPGQSVVLQDKSPDTAGRDSRSTTEVTVAYDDADARQWFTHYLVGQSRNRFRSA